jgi:predicted nucleic acid-binding protein
MQWLIDTGILLRLVNRGDPLHGKVVSSIQTLHRRREELVTSAQNIAEFWNLSTRPSQARGGLGRLGVGRVTGGVGAMGRGSATSLR